MANIMLTDVCNLHCPYCFANEFVNKSDTEITESSFQKAVDFILGDGSQHSVGLIGGEPTTHSKFSDLLCSLIKDKRAEAIILYTNGVLLDQYMDLITHKKVHILINCNAPEDIGEENYNRMCQNLDYLYLTKLFQDNMTLGINMYKPDFSYSYLMKLLLKYHQDHVRISITVPNMEDTRNHNAHDYFKTMKGRVIAFFDELLSNGIVPHFDCNKIPHCQLSSRELEPFQKYMNQESLKSSIMRSNIYDSIVKCSPVVDIRQDLTAVRCFGLSEVTKQSISDFKSITDLINFYIRTIDAYAYNTAYSAQCVNCKHRKTLKCSGGCLAFKINEILSVQEYAEKRLTELKGRNNT